MGVEDKVDRIISDVGEIKVKVAVIEERTSNMADSLDEKVSEETVKLMLRGNRTQPPTAAASRPALNGATKKVLLALAGLLTALAGYIGSLVIN